MSRVSVIEHHDTTKVIINMEGMRAARVLYHPPIVAPSIQESEQAKESLFCDGYDSDGLIAM